MCQLIYCLWHRMAKAEMGQLSQLIHIYLGKTRLFNPECNALFESEVFVCAHVFE